MKAKLFLLHALSPLHAGTGRGVGMIDLPIAREKATNIPYLPGSSLKGVLRDACTVDKTRELVFGPDTSNAETGAGAINITDLRLLLLPVRSLRGTFAWVTSPFLLQRLLRDTKTLKDVSLPTSIPLPIEDETCLVVAEESKLFGSENQEVILEDIPLRADTDTTQDIVKTWANKLAEILFPGDANWKKTFTERFCIVSDDVISFLLEVGTEVTARIALESDTKTVKDGALWYEESLPSESILSGLVIANKSEEKVFSTITELTKTPIQVGGNATVGRGFCKTRLVSKEG